MDDAPALARLFGENEDYLAPWFPVFAEAHFTVDGQRAMIAVDLERHEMGTKFPLVILDADGEVCGRVNLNDIIRGSYQGSSVGYWVSASHAGRGLASAAVTDIIGIAFKELGLHRLEASTLLHNTPSQRVLTRNGFRPFAVSEKYLKIAGKWQDHILFYLLNPDMPER